MKYVITLIAAAVLVGCGIVPEKVSAKDPRLDPMFEAVRRVDRQSLGFTPIDPGASIRIEWHPRNEYDVMLHIDGKASHTIAFRRLQSGYEWIGEQEIFEGPDRYKTVDGEFYESITINYDKVPISGFPLNTVAIQYHGEKQNLLWPHDLSLEQSRQLLKEWGY
jgi:hypothetical protein